jgi:hypothetical protein
VAEASKRAKWLRSEGFATCPHLSPVDLKAREQVLRIERLGRGAALRGSVAGRPDLNSLLFGHDQPAKLGAIGAIEAHLLAQGGKPTRSVVRWAGQFHDQVWAEGSKTAPLLRGEGLPAFQANPGNISPYQFHSQRRAAQNPKTRALV